MPSKKTEVLTALVEKLQELIPSKVKTVNYEKIKMTFSDFESWELPAIQVIDQGETSEHEQGRARKSWAFVIELVMKTTSAGIVDQKTLFDLQYEIERKLFEQPQLSVKGMIGLEYNGSQTDLHLVLPHYYVRMDIIANYYQPLVRDC